MNFCVLEINAGNRADASVGNALRGVPRIANRRRPAPHRGALAGPLAASSVGHSVPKVTRMASQMRTRGSTGGLFSVGLMRDNRVSRQRLAPARRGWFTAAASDCKESEERPPVLLLVALVAMLSFACIGASAADTKSDEIASVARVEIGEIEHKIASAADIASRSTVRIAWGKDEREGGASGVIVNAEGYIATSGKELLNAGTPVVIYLSDGRRATGAVLGASWELGVGLIKLDGQGPWPCASLGDSEEMQTGVLCLALGYPSLHRGGNLPRYEQRPLIRLGQLVCAPHVPWMLTSCRLAPGDTGGGLFDLKGRLVGIHISHRLVDGAPAEAKHARIETLKRNWDALAAGKLPGSHFDATASNRSGAAAPADQPAESNDQLRRATEKAGNASVGLQWGPAERDGCSGTIITSDGYIATCEHHQRPFGETLTVHLSDGRSVAGKVLGSDPVVDVGLMKITEVGPWPHVPLGKSVEMKPGDACVSLGFPVHRPDGKGPRWREPLYRAGRILNISLAPGSIAASGTMYGGDSGGGLFDADGRLIGIHHGQLGGQNRDSEMVWRAGGELIENRWAFLAAREPHEILPPVGLGRTAEIFLRAIGDQPPITVEVLNGEKRCSFGTVVDGGGWVLTKASELGDTVQCRLADGRRFSADVRGVVREHDLALLKLNADGLPSVAWAFDASPAAGALVAAIRLHGSPAIGVVSQSVHAVPRETGWLFIGGVRDSVNGVEVADDSDAVKNGETIRKGDVIVSLEGQPIPDFKTYLALTEKPDVGVAPVFAGDPLRIKVRRENELLDLRMRVRPEVNMPDRSLRRSGFPNVFSTDAHVSRDDCGGPVVNRRGDVAGILIAQDGNERSYVVPASVARDAFERLRAN